MNFSAGIGDPPSSLDVEYRFNASRITDPCDVAAHNRYILNLITPVDRWPEPLVFGSLWHRYLELLGNSEHARVEYIAEQAMRLAMQSAQYTSDEDFKTLCAASDWVIDACSHYHEHHKGTLPLDITNATEQPFWLYRDGVLVRGTFDAVGKKDGKTTIAEYKTVGPNADLAAEFNYRAKHPQTLLYALAAQTMYPDFGGVVFDFVARRKMPQQPISFYTKADGSVVNYKPDTIKKRLADWNTKLEEWTRGMFYREHVRSFRDLDKHFDRCLIRWRGIAAGDVWPNVAHCKRGGKPTCPYFGSCYLDVPLGEPFYTKRDKDYVG